MDQLFWNIFLIIVLSFYTKFVNGQQDRVRLQDIQTLTLTSNGWTTARRGSAIPQLRCVGGFCDRVNLFTVQCYNRGWDGRNVQWECKSEMPKEYKFGNLMINCEGYQHPDDQFVLAGSCGLEYTIVPRENVRSNGGGSFVDHNGYAFKKRPNDSFPGFPIILIIAAMILIYFTCLRKSDRRNTPGTNNHYGDDYPGAQPSAPPPPGFRTDFFGGNDSSCPGSGGGCGTQRRTGGGSSALPGFLGGMAAGGLMGYMFGSNQTRTRTPRYSPDWSGTGDFGGGGGFFSSDDRRSSSSGGVQESTGFASSSTR